MATRQREDTVLEARKSRTKPPPMFKVLLLNDDYTPMDFVVLVLQKIFALSREQATQVMLKVHREGMGVCGIYPKDVAATKVEQVRSYAKQHQLLLCFHLPKQRKGLQGHSDHYIRISLLPPCGAHQGLRLSEEEK